MYCVSTETSEYFACDRRRSSSCGVYLCVSRQMVLCTISETRLKSHWNTPTGYTVYYSENISAKFIASKLYLKTTFSTDFLESFVFSLGRNIFWSLKMVNNEYLVSRNVTPCRLENVHSYRRFERTKTLPKVRIYQSARPNIPEDMNL